MRKHILQNIYTQSASSSSTIRLEQPSSIYKSIIYGNIKSGFTARELL